MKSAVNATVQLCLSVLGRIGSVVGAFGRFRPPDSDGVRADCVPGTKHSKLSKPDVSLIRVLAKCLRPWLYVCKPDGFATIFTIACCDSKGGYGYCTFATHYNLMLLARFGFVAIEVDLSARATTGGVTATVRL